MTKVKKKERALPTRHEIRTVLTAARKEGKLNNRRIDAVASLLWEAWKVCQLSAKGGIGDKALVVERPSESTTLAASCLECGEERSGDGLLVHADNCPHKPSVAVVDTQEAGQ